MSFTDIFIRRPVLATVVSLLILVLGLRSLASLPIRQFPMTQDAVITVSTTYTGADSDAIAGFITTPLENAISQANGIDYITSTSSPSNSTIKAVLRLNYDPNKALTEINSKVGAVLSQLPKDARPPVISVAIGQTIDSMYIGFYSDALASNQITDYLVRIVQPKLQTVEGVQQAEILGGREFALRAWLDPKKLAAYQLNASDIATALAKNDFISAIGRTDGDMMTLNLTSNTGLESVETFRKLIIKTKNGAIVHLEDVANVTLGSESYDSAVSFDGESAVYIGIKVAPTANILSVIESVRQVFPSIQAQLPTGLNGKIVYDATRYIDSAIFEVNKSLIEALLIVTLVIFLFLGSLRSVTIPVIAMPLSLIGTFFMMLVFGYSINLLTLLALVLAIGLVVDDAIIIVENIHRHIEEGTTPLNAALQGARELANPIIAISVVLIAVYVPIGFLGGLTGSLFTEFAFTLASSVAISAIIALTLSPVMCAKLLKPSQTGNGRFVAFVDHCFERLEYAYQRTLKNSLNYLPVTGVFALIILTSIYFLYHTSKSELAPQEDQGILISLLTTAPNATLTQTQLYSRQAFKAFVSIPETDHIFQLDGVNGINSSIGGMVLKPWDQRHRTATQIQPELQAALDKIAGARIVAFQPPSLPGGGSGLAIQFVLQTTESFQQLDTVAQALIRAAYASGKFMYLDNDLKIDKAQTTLELDRNKVAQLGLTMQDVSAAMGAAVSQANINYFNLDGRAYQVIPQLQRVDRLNPSELLDYHVNTANGASIPLSTIVNLKTTVVPEMLTHFQQLNSTTISAIAIPGVSIGEALDTLQALAEPLMSSNYTVDYAGQSRQFKQEGSALVTTFFFALIIIFLSLAALFESFRDPFIVLISVPMSICGAMIFISMGVGGASLNIYTEVGLVTLIGLISKHGILIVQFANDLQRDGKTKREAIEMAAHIRLRPILMTTAAMVLGVAPLLMATGAGAVSRFDIGLVITTGISIGTLFTLFVVPAVYLLLAKDRTPNKSLSYQ